MLSRTLKKFHIRSAKALAVPRRKWRNIADIIGWMRRFVFSA